MEALKAGERGGGKGDLRLVHFVRAIHILTICVVCCSSVQFSVLDLQTCPHSTLFFLGQVAAPSRAQLQFAWPGQPGHVQQERHLFIEAQLECAVTGIPIDITAGAGTLAAVLTAGLTLRLVPAVAEALSFNPRCALAELLPFDHRLEDPLHGRYQRQTAALCHAFCPGSIGALPEKEHHRLLWSGLQYPHCVSEAVLGQRHSKLNRGGGCT